MCPQNTHLNFIFETETLSKVVKRHEQTVQKKKKDTTWPLAYEEMFTPIHEKRNAN